MDWIISDTHFMHEKIIGFASRPYRNATEMDVDLIRRWNNRVKPEDTVYHLGDVGMTKGELLAGILARLNGKKILTVGNHDKSAKRMMEFGFTFACEGIRLIPDGTHRTVYLTHKPLAELPVGVDYVLHGHIHNSTPESRAQHVSKGELIHIPPFNVNMCVEKWNYEPVPLRWVVRKKIAEDRGRSI